MFNFFSPIDFNTPVNSITLPYFTGDAVGFDTSWWGYSFTPAPCCIFTPSDYFPFMPVQTGGIFDFIPQNPYENLFNFGYKNQYASNPVKPEKCTAVKTSQPKQEIKKTTSNTGQDLRNTILHVANKYSNCKESDNSHLKFCINPACKQDDPENKEWCTDFVTYVTKEAYANRGITVPDGFGSHDVSTLKNWAINNGYYFKTAGQSNKGNLIAGNIKAGDIVIFNELKPDGTRASHTGFVKEVLPDGRFKTIEGNRNDRVSSATYSPNFNELSGFIQLS